MLRRLLRFFAPALLILVLGLAPAQAQTAAGPEGEKTEKSISALPYFVMTLYAMLVMTIVCMPSRKA